LVAVFAWFFSYFFGQVHYILMFFVITGAIWLGGAGPCIVGGLYWKRGTSVGAFAALASGTILAVSGFICQKTWVEHLYPWLVETQMIDTVRAYVEGAADPFRPYINWRVTGEGFPINSQEIYFIAMVISITLYVTLSLLTCRKPFNMDRMLHRGKYQIEGKKIRKPKWSLRRLIGIDEQYTRGDKILAWSVFIWSFGWGFGCCFIGIILWNKFYAWPKEWWAIKFFITNIVVSSIVGIVSTVWFTIGGTWDLRRLFKRLAEKEEDILDDGRVVDNVSAADVAMVEEVDHITIKEAHDAEKALEEELKEEAEEDS
jgi:SSS family solute:Na+ symporter